MGQIYAPFGEKTISNPSIGDVVGWMCKLAWKGHLDTKVRNLAEEIIRPLESGDYAGECVAWYYWMLANFRYALDPRGQEFTRWPQGQFELMSSGEPRFQEDCDGHAVFSAAGLESIGHQCLFCLAHFSNSPVPTHVFCVVNARGKGIMAIDSVAGRDTPRMLSEMTHYTLVDVETGCDSPVLNGSGFGSPFSGWAGWKP